MVLGVVSVCWGLIEHSSRWIDGLLQLGMGAILLAVALRGLRARDSTPKE